MADNEISVEIPFESKFIEVDGSFVHYVEAGQGDPIFFLHGKPTSCYLWRNVVPHLLLLARCVAIDFIGMGRSDKPDLDYRFLDHARYVKGVVAALARHHGILSRIHRKHGADCREELG